MRIRLRRQKAQTDRCTSGYWYPMSSTYCARCGHPRANGFMNMACGKASWKIRIRVVPSVAFIRARSRAGGCSRPCTSGRVECGSRLCSLTGWPLCLPAVPSSVLRQLAFPAGQVPARAEMSSAQAGGAFDFAAMSSARRPVLLAQANFLLFGPEKTITCATRSSPLPA